MSSIGKFSGRRPIRTGSGMTTVTTTTAMMAAVAAALVLVATSTSARAGSFNLTGEIDPARQYHTATLLPNGKVLVAGGYGSGGVGWLIDCQLYDPQKGEFGETGRLTTRRDAHTA